MSHHIYVDYMFGMIKTFMMMKTKLFTLLIPVLALAAWVFVAPATLMAKGQESWPLERPVGNMEKQKISHTFQMQLVALVGMFSGGDKDREAEATLKRMSSNTSFTTFELQALRGQMAQVFFERGDIDRAIIENKALVQIDESNYFLVDQAHMQLAATHFLKADSAACLQSLYQVVPYQKNYTFSHLNALAECHYYEAVAKAEADGATAMEHYADAYIFAFNTIDMFGWDGGKSISLQSNAGLLGPILMASAWQMDRVPDAYNLLEYTAAKNPALDLWMFTLSAYDSYTKAGVELKSTLFDDVLLQQLAESTSPSELEAQVQAIIDQKIEADQ